jgi:hypothetical protein
MSVRVSRRAFATSLAAASVAKSNTIHQPEVQQIPKAPSTISNEWQPKLFDSHQLETVARLADIIIPRTDTPGASDARVHQHLDEILFHSDRASRDSFLEGLWWLDGYSLQSQAAPFKSLAAEAQVRIISQLLESTDENLRPGREFAESLKRWTARIYYSTEAGESELNKGGRTPPAYAHDCET